MTTDTKQITANKPRIDMPVQFLKGVGPARSDIFAKLGVDITNKKFWEKGIKEVDALLSETEKLAKKLGKI